MTFLSHGAISASMQYGNSWPSLELSDSFVSCIFIGPYRRTRCNLLRSFLYLFDFRYQAWDLEDWRLMGGILRSLRGAF